MPARCGSWSPCRYHELVLDRPDKSRPPIGCPHGQAGRLRAPGTRGARRPVRAAVVHRRARVPQVRRGGAGRAGGRVRRGHRLRRLGDRGLRPRLRVRHAAQARPLDVPDPAVARRGPGDGADVLRHRDAGRLPVVRRPALRPQAHPEPRRPTRASPSTRTPRSSSTSSRTPRSSATSRSRSTAAATSTTPRSRKGADFRREAITQLESMGISVEFSHHEGGPGQQEIDLRYADALSTADNVMTFRTVIREVALSQGIWATFMPKPYTTHPGLGHAHARLAVRGRPERLLRGRARSTSSPRPAGSSSPACSRTRPR